MPDASGYHLLEFALLNFDESPFRFVLSLFTSMNLQHTRKPHERVVVANSEFKRRCRAMKLRNTSERDRSTKLVSITQVRKALLSLRHVQDRFVARWTSLAGGSEYNWKFQLSLVTCQKELLTSCLLHYDNHDSINNAALQLDHGWQWNITVCLNTLLERVCVMPHLLQTCSSSWATSAVLARPTQSSHCA